VTLNRLQRFLRSGIPSARIKPLSRSRRLRPFVVTPASPSPPTAGRRTESLVTVTPPPTAATTPPPQVAGPTPEAEKLPTQTPRMTKLVRRSDVVDDPEPAPDPPGVTPAAGRASRTLPAAPPARVRTQPTSIPPVTHSEKAKVRLDRPVVNAKRELLTRSEVVVQAGSPLLVVSPSSTLKLGAESAPGSRTPPAQISERAATAPATAAHVMTALDEKTPAENLRPRSTPAQHLFAGRHSTAPVAGKPQAPHRAPPISDAFRPVPTAPHLRAQLSPGRAPIGEPPKPAVSVHIGRVEVKSAAKSETTSQLSIPPRHHSIALRGWHEGL